MILILTASASAPSLAVAVRARADAHADLGQARLGTVDWAAGRWVDAPNVVTQYNPTSVPAKECSRTQKLRACVHAHSAGAVVSGVFDLSLTTTPLHIHAHVDYIFRVSFFFN